MAAAQTPGGKKGENVNKGSASLTIGAWGLAVMFAQPLPVNAADEASKDIANTIELICLTEQPAIVEGESATLRAWASTADGRPISQPIVFEWEVKEGRIENQAAETRWDLSAVRVEPNEGRKRLVAIVKAAQPSSGEVRCAVEVFLGKKQAVFPDRGTIRGESLWSAKRYLLPGESEEPGYGLYSYLLFSAPPRGNEETTRYLKTIEAYLLVLQDVDEFLARHVRPSRLNATYIPLRKAPVPGNSNAEWAANVLAAYDYTAAQILLSKLDKSHRQGPYLVSALGPLSEANTPTHLFEDLTEVVPDLAWNWVKFFTYLAAQERSWSDESLQRFGLNLRNLVAVGGKVTPDILKGLKIMIRFKRGT
jgi:hypothetical protein